MDVEVLISVSMATFHFLPLFYFATSRLCSSRKNFPVPTASIFHLSFHLSSGIAERETFHSIEVASDAHAYCNITMYHLTLLHCFSITWGLFASKYLL